MQIFSSVKIPQWNTQHVLHIKKICTVLTLTEPSQTLLAGRSEYSKLCLHKLCVFIVFASERRNIGQSKFVIAHPMDVILKVHLKKPGIP